MSPSREAYVRASLPRSMSPWHDHIQTLITWHQRPCTWTRRSPWRWVVQCFFRSVLDYRLTPTFFELILDRWFWFFVRRVCQLTRNWLFTSGIPSPHRSTSLSAYPPNNIRLCFFDTEWQGDSGQGKVQNLSRCLLAGLFSHLSLYRTNSRFRTFTCCRCACLRKSSWLLSTPKIKLLMILTSPVCSMWFRQKSTPSPPGAHKVIHQARHPVPPLSTSVTWQCSGTYLPYVDIALFGCLTIWVSC
jgi:hypothetical protein